ncbi:MAG: hypothetical protein PHW08_01365 [Kiritimatiellae bacterium]|nr:hypothetical protein [Kiritimatiellia bacterium]
MKDDVSVETNFPGGNACVLDVCERDGVPEVHFMPSPRGGPEAMWFHLRLLAGSTCPAVRCRLHLPDILLGGQSEPKGFAPVFRTECRDWTRVASVTPQARADGRPVYVWEVPGGEGRVETALCFPYGEAQLATLVKDLAWRKDVIGLTSAERGLFRVSNDFGAPAATRPGVYCLARQHAGETPGSWVLDGFLRAMAQAGAAAPLVWAVPFTDPDGVIEGRYGKDAFPWDFNRSWGSKHFPTELRAEMGSHPMRHEIKSIQHDLVAWALRCSPRIVLDFHAPGMCETSGIYCYLRDVDAEGRPDESHRPWVEAFARSLVEPWRADSFVRSGRYLSRWNTARLGDFVTRAMKLPACTFETPYAQAHESIFALEDYRAAGRGIAQAVLEVLAVPPST